jgi:hypothetical protein
MHPLTTPLIGVAGKTALAHTLADRMSGNYGLLEALATDLVIRIWSGCDLGLGDVR